RRPSPRRQRGTALAILERVEPDRESDREPPVEPLLEVARQIEHVAVAQLELPIHPADGPVAGQDAPGRAEQRLAEGDRPARGRLAGCERGHPVEVRDRPDQLVDEVAVELEGAYLPALLMRMPRSSGARSGAPHSSQSTAKVDENGASQDGQRRSMR